MSKYKIINTNIVSYMFLILAFFFFFFHLSNIPRPFFDEFHYIPAAKQWLNMNPTSNIEHPPLGKYLIAGSIKIFGDNPIGWRLSSVLFGSLSLMTIFLIAEIIFKDLVLAIFVGLSSMFNFWFYVQSRIGMLDIFMVSFLVFGFYCFLKNTKVYYCFSSIFFGLAVAIKWSAIFTYFPLILIALFINRSQKNILELFQFVLLSVAVYFFTFIPYLFVSGSYRMSLLDIFFKTPINMLKLQQSVPMNHPYASSWYTWPLMIRPIWYEFIVGFDNLSFRGVQLLGNPIQMFVGLLAVFWIMINILKFSKIAKSTLFLFLFSWLIWGLTPRKLTFFYYYFPNALFYSFLIPMSLTETFGLKKSRVYMGIITLLSIGFFVYFYPILSGVEALMSIRGKWSWLETWI